MAHCLQMSLRTKTLKPQSDSLDLPWPGLKHRTRQTVPWKVTEPAWSNLWHD